MTAKSARNEIKAMLAVFGFEGSPAEVTSLLGVTPTKTWLKGTPVVPGALNLHHQNGWAVYSEVFPEMDDADKAVQAVLDKCDVPSAFANLPAGSEVQLTVTIFGRTDRPGLWLSAETVKRLGLLGATLDADIYDLTAADSDSDEG